MIALAGVLIIFVVCWVGMALYGTIRPSPTLQDFTPRSQLKSSILREVTIDQLVQATTKMPGVRVTTNDGGSLMLSLSPSFRSIERGTGAWVKIAPAHETWLLEIRAKSALNWVSYRQALAEFERELRMALRSVGAASFNIHEGVVRSNLPAEHTEGGGAGKWWE